MKGKENEIEIIKISRQLTPEHRAELLTRARRACEEQNTACEPAGHLPAVGEPQEFACKDTENRF